MNSNLDKTISRSRALREYHRTRARRVRIVQRVFEVIEFVTGVAKTVPPLKPLVVIEVFASIAGGLAGAKVKDHDDYATIVGKQINRHEQILSSQNFEETGFEDIKRFFEDGEISGKPRRSEMGIREGEPLGPLRELEEEWLRDFREDISSVGDSSRGHYVREMYKDDINMAVSSIA